MKIIGETEGGLLLSASKDEVSQILGYANAWHARDKEGREGADRDPLRLGRTIKMADLYLRAKRVGELRTELDKAVAGLRGIASAVEVYQPLLAELE